MITLDASVVIALLASRDSHHGEAKAIFETHAGESLLMHSLNLTEVLVGGARTGRAEEMLADLQALGIQVAERVPDEPLNLATLRARTGLRHPDCCALDTALRSATPLVTFDRALAKAALNQGLTVL